MLVAPSEYVTANDSACSDHLIAVRYYSHLNASTVDSNGLVTEAQGAALPEGRGLEVWEASENLFWDSANPATQNITTTAQSYTVSIKGTGDITLTGAATGTATEASPLTVTATAGTLTCTVNGTVTEPQVEAKGYKTPYVPTPVGASATRLADNAQATWPSGLVNDFVIGCDFINKSSNIANAVHGWVGTSQRIYVGPSARLITALGSEVLNGEVGVIIEGVQYNVKLRKSSTQSVTQFIDDDINSQGVEVTDGTFPSEFGIGNYNVAGRYLNGNIKNFILVSGDLSDSEVIDLGSGNITHNVVHNADNVIHNTDNVVLTVPN